MSVRIQFDQPNTWHFTNLDFVTGRVILTLQSDATISAINVKLEGESRTRLAGPKSPHEPEKRKTELELHKILYNVQTVFPSPSLQRQSLSNPNFTLLAGQYTYPFKFKFPFNNSCTSNTSLLRDLKLGALNVQLGPDTNRHVRKGLPPTLRGFPGEAEIRYYVKVTVVRPKFYLENLRTQVDIKFLPIEPPRLEGKDEETFARRKQQFQRHQPLPPKKGIFRRTSGTAGSDEVEPPLIQVDARLPSPPVITCNEPLPLRILVQRLNESEAVLYLAVLHIELIGMTNVRAQDLSRTEYSTWLLVSQANINMRLGDPLEVGVQEWKVPERFWQNIPLPNTVCPSFDTCNLSRRYELDVRVGLAHGPPNGAMGPELVVVPLRMPIKVYSGIKPTPELLQAMASQHRPSRPINHSYPVNGSSYESQVPPTPLSPNPEQNLFPAQAGSPVPQNAMPEPDDAPPSYEDAIAEEIAPVDGPRRDYDVMPDPQRRQSAFNDDKGGGLSRRVSERLFSQNSPGSSSRADPHRSSWDDSSPVSATPQQTQSTIDEEEIGTDVVADRAPARPPRS